MPFIVFAIIAILAYCVAYIIVKTKCDRKAASMKDEELDIQSSILFDELEEKYSLSKYLMYRAMVEELNRRKL